MTTNSPEDLAARLDEILPPGRADLDNAPRDPALRAALELARDSRPVLSAAARAHIQAQMLAQADHVFTRPRTSPMRRLFTLRWAAAIIVTVVLAAFLVTTLTGDTSHHPAPVADQAHTSGLIVAPSAPDTALFIPQDALSTSLTEIGTGSTSIFIQPLTP